MFFGYDIWLLLRTPFFFNFYVNSPEFLFPFAWQNSSTFLRCNFCFIVYSIFSVFPRFYCLEFILFWRMIVCDILYLFLILIIIYFFSSLVLTLLGPCAEEWRFEEIVEA
jgi:hypothetical protein